MPYLSPTLFLYSVRWHPAVEYSAVRSVFVDSVSSLYLHTTPCHRSNLVASSALLYLSSPYRYAALYPLPLSLSFCDPVRRYDHQASRPDNRPANQPDSLPVGQPDHPVSQLGSRPVGQLGSQLVDRADRQPYQLSVQLIYQPWHPQPGPHSPHLQGPVHCPPPCLLERQQLRLCQVPQQHPLTAL